MRALGGSRETGTDADSIEERSTSIRQGMIMLKIDDDDDVKEDNEEGRATRRAVQSERREGREGREEDREGRRRSEWTMDVNSGTRSIYISYSPSLTIITHGPSSSWTIIIIDYHHHHTSGVKRDK